MERLKYNMNWISWKLTELNIEEDINGQTRTGLEGIIAEIRWVIIN